MTRSRLKHLTLGLCLFWAAQVHAETTLSDELRAFAITIGAQCKSVSQQYAGVDHDQDPLTAYTLRDAVQSLCVCIPARTRVLARTRTHEDLASPITEEDFLALLKTDVFDGCAAVQLKAMYGEDCTARFKAPGLDARKYCSCMRAIVSTYSEGVAASIAFAAADYLPRAAAAESNGESPPERPAVLESYFLVDKACKDQ